MNIIQSINCGHWLDKQMCNSSWRASVNIVHHSLRWVMQPCSLANSRTLRAWIEKHEAARVANSTGLCPWTRLEKHRENLGLIFIIFGSKDRLTALVVHENSRRSSLSQLSDQESKPLTCIKGECKIPLYVHHEIITVGCWLPLKDRHTNP